MQKFITRKLMCRLQCDPFPLVIRLVDSSVFFDTLYTLIGLGSGTSYQAGNIRTAHRLLLENARSRGQQHDGAQTMNSQELQGSQGDDRGVHVPSTAWVYGLRPLPLFNPLSPPEAARSMTRIKMVCQLLEASGRYFSKGSSKLKLERFLALFRRYCLLKVS